MRTRTSGRAFWTVPLAVMLAVVSPCSPFRAPLRRTRPSTSFASVPRRPASTLDCGCSSRMSISPATSTTRSASQAPLTRAPPTRPVRKSPVLPVHPVLKLRNVGDHLAHHRNQHLRIRLRRQPERRPDHYDRDRHHHRRKVRRLRRGRDADRRIPQHPDLPLRSRRHQQHQCRIADHHPLSISSEQQHYRLALGRRK